MKRPSSYQRRKENIKFLEQCIEELEEIAFDLGRQIVEAGEEPKLRFLRKGIDADRFITPYNYGSANFYFRFFSKVKGKKCN